MSTTDLHADLIRRAEACDELADGYAMQSRAAVEHARVSGKAAAYRHAAELLRGAVAAAVEEERAACAALAEDVVVCHGGAAVLFVGDAIRARRESPRGDAVSDGREGAE